MAKPKLSEIDYDERTDDQRLESNWRKARGLFKRGDHSASIMRAATSAEIAANIYVRHFLLSEHDVPVTFVDALLFSANGLDGKFKRLIRPAAEHRGTWGQLKPLQKRIEVLHEHRNSIAHAGYFKDEDEAKEALASSMAIIRALAPNESKKLALPYES
jgi:hypothetical protein